MGKKRKIKSSVYGVVEGNREKLFLEFLVEIYNPRANNINPNFENSSGGTPDKIIGTALKHADRDKVFAWLDEDFEPDYPIGEDVKKHLAQCWGIKKDNDEFLGCSLSVLQENYNSENKKKPTLIVSKPVCVESVILRILGVTPPYKEYTPENRAQQIRALKAKLKATIGESDEKEFYRLNLSKEILDNKRKEVDELDLLISMITKNT